MGRKEGIFPNIFVSLGVGRFPELSFRNTGNIEMEFVCFCSSNSAGKTSSRSQSLAPAFLHPRHGDGRKIFSLPSEVGTWDDGECDGDARLNWSTQSVA